MLTSVVLALVLGRLTWIDLRSFRLPDVYTLPLIGAGLVLSLGDGGIGLTASMLGGAIGFALFWAVGQVYFTRFGKDGLGLGDAKLFAASGTWLGYMLLPYVLLVASVGGLIFALLAQPNTSARIAFGPWLSLGFLLIWILSQLNVIG